jgi:CheY-like chemotaxis protein
LRHLKAGEVEVSRILVVDDQQEVVDLSLDGLRDYVPGLRLEGACGGYEALLKIGSFQPHLVVLDLRMPGLDGFEVCRRVREAPETKATKIVAMTSFEDDQAEQLALTCGADAFLTKRAGLAALGRQIMSLLEAEGKATAAVVRPPRARARQARETRSSKSERKTRR